MQAVTGVPSGGKFYRLPPDKENTAEETYRPFLHYAPVSKNKEMRTRLGWTCNFIQITVFFPPEAQVGAFVYRNAEKVYSF